MSNIFVELTKEELAVSKYRCRLEDDVVGAHAWFEGVTRRYTGDDVTVSLEYEAFEPMAFAQLRSLAETVQREFQLTSVLIVHRLGQVAIGEASLLVGVSAPHRKNVFLALAEIVDRLKRDVPIWKKEAYENGSTQWIHPQ